MSLKDKIRSVFRNYTDDGLAREVDLLLTGIHMTNTYAPPKEWRKLTERTIELREIIRLEDLK